MVLSELQKIGFTTGEAKVYLALLKHGEQTKSTLACNADVSSSKIYEIAEKLIKKGIASSIIRNGKKFYQGSEPEHLNTYIKNKELELQNEKEIVKDIIPMISGEKKSRDTKVQIFEGWKGYEIALKEAINNMPFEATIKGIGIEMPRIDLLHKYHRERRAKKIKQQLIFPNRDLKKSKYRENERRYIKNISKVGVGIFPDRIIIQTLEKEQITIVIKDKDIIESFEQIHKNLWLHANKL